MESSRYGQPTGNDLHGIRQIRYDDNNRFKYIRVTNIERSSGTPNNFQICLGNDPILDKCIEIQLVSASIPNMGYNVSEARGNNIFSVTFLPNTVASITLVDGQYTTAQILTQINTIVPPTGTFVATQSALTGKITLTSSSASFVINGSSIFPNTTGINSYLGFTTTSPLGGSLVWTADGRPALYGDTMFYVHSSDLAINATYLNNTLSGGGTNDVNGFISIPINVPYNTYQTYQPIERDRVTFGRYPKSVKNIQFTLRSDFGRILTLTDNDVVTIVLKMFYEVDARN